MSLLYDKETKMKETIKLNGQLRMYLAWPLLLALFPAFGNIGVAMVSRVGGALLFPFTLCHIAAAIWIYTYRKRRLLGGLVEFSSTYAWAQKRLLEEMAVPYALCDEDGRILWLNDAFRQALSEKKLLRKNITTLFTEVTKADLATEEIAQVHASYGGRQIGRASCRERV